MQSFVLINQRYCGHEVRTAAHADLICQSKIKDSQSFCDQYFCSPPGHFLLKQSPLISSLMSTKRYNIDPLVSLLYCIKHYASYGNFATYCLRTVVSATDVYTFSTFKQCYTASGENHANNPKLRKFLETVSYEDSDYFSISEIRFLLQLTAFCSPRSDAKVERDLRRVTREIKLGKRILPSHASILAKAIEYWKLRYNDKYVEWSRRAADVHKDRITRSKLRKVLEIAGNHGPL
jgi:hypothetical protein